MVLLLLAAISGMVFSISRSSLKLGKAIVDSQAVEMEQQAFFQLLGRRFASLPGNARLELYSEPSGRLYLSDLTLQEVPMSFTWGGQDRLAKAVQISTVQRRSGYLDIVMRYYEEEILEGSGSDFEGVAEDEPPFAEIVLLRDVAYFEWRVFDSNTMEWFEAWDEKNRLPLQLELLMAIGAEGKPLRHVFWLPPKQNPELVMRQLGENNPTSTGGGEGSPHGGASIEIGSPRQTEGGGR